MVDAYFCYYNNIASMPKRKHERSKPLVKVLSFLINQSVEKVFAYVIAAENHKA